MSPDTIVDKIVSKNKFMLTPKEKTSLDWTISYLFLV